MNEGFKLVDIEGFTPELAVLQEILSDLPELEASDGVQEASLAKEGGPHAWQQVDGAALRVLFHFLDTADPSHWWHGLSQVYSPDGSMLWVCEQHRREYEPGLITVG